VGTNLIVGTCITSAMMSPFLTSGRYKSIKRGIGIAFFKVSMEWISIKDITREQGCPYLN